MKQQADLGISRASCVVQDAAENLGSDGVTARGGDSVGVDVQGGRRSCMAEPGRHRRDGDARGQHGGRHEVAKIMKTTVHLRYSAIGDELFGHPVRWPRGPAVLGKDEAQATDVGSGSVCPLYRPVIVSDQDLETVGVEIDSIGTTGLGRAQYRTALRIKERSKEADLSSLEIDITPTQRPQPAPAGSGRDRQRQEGVEIGIDTGDMGEEADDLFGTGG